MQVDKISIGKNPPEDINVIIEIPMMVPIKYELDKESGAVVVDRFISTPMYYPCNYGFVPGTLSDDGDPTDVLVVSQFPIQAGAVIRCRPIGVLLMEDESGFDEKIIAVPHSKLTPFYNNVHECSDLPEILISQIKHFFEHYKDLEKGKWVKVKEWGNAAKARDLITAGIERAG